MKIIAVSTTNTASNNIGRLLLKKYAFEDAGDEFDGYSIRAYKDTLLIRYDGSVLDCNKVLEAVTEKVEVLIVASSHKSEAGINTLTAHTTGNWEKATSGGEENTLSIAPALYLRTALLEFKKLRDERNLDYEISFESTHHGPTINTPIIFVEVGSGETQYNDMAACEVAADVIHKLIRTKLSKIKVGVGFGGTHYATTFTKRVLEGNLAVGHICPKHYCENLTEEMFLQAVKKNSPKADFVVLDWKGLKGAEKHRFIEWCDKHGIYWRKSDDFKQLPIA